MRTTSTSLGLCALLLGGCASQDFVRE